MPCRPTLNVGLHITWACTQQAKQQLAKKPPDKIWLLAIEAFSSQYLYIPITGLDKFRVRKEDINRLPHAGRKTLAAAATAAGPRHKLAPEVRFHAGEALRQSGQPAAARRQYDLVLNSEVPGNKWLEQAALGKIRAALDAEDLAAVEQEAARCGMPFVSDRWLGGTLTNFRTIRSRLTRLEELESLRASDELSTYSKKMQSALNREYRKMFRNLNGIRTMNRLPEESDVARTYYNPLACHVPAKRMTGTSERRLAW